MPQVPSDGASAQKEFLTFKSGRSSRRSAANLPDMDSNCARAVAVEQVNGKQVREMSVIFTTDRIASARQSAARAVGSGWVEPTPLASWKPPGDKYIDMLLTDANRKERIARIEHTIAELSALMKTGRQKVTSASYQTYAHARAIAITITAVIKLSSAQVLAGLWPSLSCIVMGDDLPRMPAPRLTG